MKKTVAALSLATLFVGAAGSAMAQDNDPWLVRFRAVNISTENNSDPVGGTGPGDRITVQNKTIPEVDISYFFTPNIAAELVLTYPQTHDVYLDGSKIGSFKELPPTLLLQYHFLPQGSIDPYVGAGVNYTHISDVNLLNGAGTLESHSTGGALQAGVDFKIDKAWSINLDVKKVWIGSDVYAGGAKISAVRINPVLIGLGVGYRF
ncbi:MAG TPA: OmpW family outer membrane protein [Burkholderiaceae bacterium]